jgi:hypothetical protein
MKKVQLLLLALTSAVIVPQISRAQYASSVISYTPGTGANASFISNPNATLGAPALGSGVTPFAPPFSNTQISGIGAGGQITLQMSTPILDNVLDPYGLDFLLFGNQFFVNSSSGVTGVFDHSPVVTIKVSADDSTWFTLNPALAPEPILFPTTGNGNPLIPVNPALTLNNFLGQNLAGINFLYNGSAGGTGYDLAWAQDSNGNNANLTSASYVQIDVTSGIFYLDAVSEVAPVPEPTTWALISVGAGLGWLYRRKKTV